MNKDVYSNSELTELKNRINKEMLRRGSYKWWGPLSQPKVGEDTRSPDSIPHDKTSIPVTDQTYTINNPSIGSIAPTRNIIYPNQGENPAGQNPDGQTPTTSAARFDLDEIKNFLVGISKVRDINLFYSQDEQEFLAFRDLGDVRKLVSEIESDRLNEPTTHPFKVDPNAPDRITVIKDGKTWTEPNPNKNIPYEKIGDKYYMSSGEMDGEEGIPSETNYYDDYGAEPGNGNYHSLNPYVSARVDRTGYDFDNNRNKIPVGRMEGGKSSSRFGMTPRNPQQGDSYQPRVAYQGVPSTCNNACSGLCFRAGTLIETINGPVPIESIRIGDLVLTQSGQYHKVYSIFRRTPKYDELIKLNIVGIPSIFTTKKHPFWTRRFIGRKHTGNGYPQIYSEPEWVDAKDLKPRDKVCLLSRNPGSTSVNHGVAYMVGRWLGDGWRTDEFDRHIGRYFTRFQICCGKHEIYDFANKLKECKIHYTKRENRTSYSFRISRNHIGANKELGPEFNNVALLNIISKCGKGAAGKLIPQEIFEWDEDSIRTLIHGYIDADGHDTGRVTMITSVSKKLIYGISILMRMVGIVPSWTHRQLKYHTGYIEGRKVNLRDRFIITILNDLPTRNYSFIDESGNIWTTVRTSEYKNLEEYDVYNLSVEEDPTYYADGVLVHNCSLTCDSQCSESCSTSCFGRCGNACTSTCGNVCTGCSSLCYTSCQSKCENNTGFACVKSGATTLSIAARGGKDGTPAYNEMKVGAPYACTQCSFSCQFYPNKKTTCWDNGCMGMCFTSCMHSCSTSCFGGCVDNPSENKGDYKTGIGRGCSSGCTVNCIGVCRGTCTGSCDSGCWNSCIESCKDNCEWECSTSCGSGCMTGCTSGCKDECNSCTNTCTAASGAKTTCNNGCVAYCMQGCNKNCVSNGCMAMCGSEGTDACDMNCRMNCMAASCTSRCSEKCTTYCTSCINTCGFGCGACSSLCNTGCEAACNITCTAHCQHSCDLNCVKSCTEACGGCSQLCTSCVGMCIGECSVKCTNNCSLCANNCGHWCDTKCSQNCFANCDNSCMQTCTNSCIGTVTSNSKQPLAGPERPPTAHGYKTPHPSNREEERESFRLLHDINQITTDRIIRDWKERLKKKSPYSTVPDTKICIKVKSNDNIKVIFTDCDPVPYNIYYSTVTGGVFNIDEKTGTILINHKALEEWAKSGYKKVVKNVNQKDGEDVSIIAVVLHCKDTNLTIDDVSYLRPLGYDFYTPYHTKNGDIICILQYLINYMEYDKNKHPNDQHITYPKRL